MDAVLANTWHLWDGSRGGINSYDWSRGKARTTQERKKPGAALWGIATAFLVMALVVGYPFSWGPYLWLQVSGKLPESLLWPTISTTRVSGFSTCSQNL